jgi:Glycosyl hydrolase family 20, catalytic domain
MKNLKIQHLRLCPHSMRTEHIKELFEKFAGAGFNTVFIEYEYVYPYKNFPDLKNDATYSAKEIASIVKSAKDCNLQIIPKGLSFSHISSLLKLDKYRHLKDGSGGLNLLNPESFEIMLSSGKEIIESHPDTTLIHFGGDEIFDFPRLPETNSYVVKNGISSLYVQFVNKLAKEFKKRGVKIAIWSDMLIRYPDSIDDLDKDVIIFYWNYWSYSERVHFLSIGGGMLDSFILDRSHLPVDLEKIFRVSIAREKCEIPIGHVDTFKEYWEMDNEWESCAGFPYLKWFRDKGLDVVSAMLPYPEKGSFLPNMTEKIDHVRTFLKKTKEHSALGFVSCCWQDNWPLLETVWPGMLFALAANDNPELSNDEIFKLVVQKLDHFGNEDMLKKYFSAGRYFEFADLLDPFWGKIPICERVDWLRRANWLEDDNKRARGVIERSCKLLNGAFLELPEDCYEKLVLEDINWRAHCQIACATADGTAAKKLINDGEILAERMAVFFDTWYSNHSAIELNKQRYTPWIKALKEVL